MVVKLILIPVKFPLEKEMAAHSNILAWKIPWTEEPGGLQSMGLQRVGHDWAHMQNFHAPKKKWVIYMLFVLLNSSKVYIGHSCFLLDSCLPPAVCKQVAQWVRLSPHSGWVSRIPFFLLFICHCVSHHILAQSINL